MSERDNEVFATSWTHLQELLFDNSWDAGIGRFRSKYAFRGLSDSSFQLKTSLIRLGGEYVTLEQHLLRNFMKYAYRNVVDRDSLWHWLSVAQHHGLPTRLLDWTSSPMVAAHFATANLEKYDLDGAIWMVNYSEAHKSIPLKLRELLKKEGANLFTAKMLSETVGSLEELRELSDESFPVFLEPPSIDDRIVNQHALFSLFSSSQTIADKWLEMHPELWKKIVIPAELKWEIRDKLDQSNVTERVLFPGLDGLSEWLRRYYSPNCS